MVTNSVVIHQAHFLPWLPYMAKVACSKKFVVLDNVQFKPRYYINRTRIVINGELKWLTIPTNGSINVLTKDTEVCFGKDFNKVSNLLKVNFHCHKNYEIIAEYINCIDNFKGNHIIDLNIRLIRIFFNQLNFKIPEIYYSSKILGNHTVKDRTERTIKICNITKSAVLINGFGGSITAHDINQIKNNAIHMVYINKESLFSKYKKYQRYSGLSFLWNLLNDGLDNTKEELDELIKMYSEELS